MMNLNQSIIVFILWSCPLSILFAQRAQGVVYEMMIPVSGALLEARLKLPSEQLDSVPLVVFLAGSGDGSFEGYLPDYTPAKVIDFESVLIPHGYAILYFNKRGVGQSTGNWKRRDFYDRADDVDEVIKYMRNLDYINFKQIGLVGHSQGGWIAQIVSSRSDKVDFIINVAGPSVGVWDQNIQDSQSDFHCLQLTEEEFATAMKKRKRNLKLGIFLGKIFPFGGIGFWSRISDFENEDHLKKMNCPALFLFAENDSMVPPQPNIDRLYRYFGKDLSAHIQVRVIPETDHFFHFDEDSCFDFPETLSSRHSEVFYETLSDWIAHLSF